MDEAIEGEYMILGGDIVLTGGFDGFIDAANIEDGSMVLVKVEARAEAIGLHFLEVY